jgi:hypothetical protein
MVFVRKARYDPILALKKWGKPKFKAFSKITGQIN